MQRVKAKRKRWQSLLILAGIIAALVLAIVLLVQLFNGGHSGLLKRSHILPVCLHLPDGFQVSFQIPPLRTDGFAYLALGLFTAFGEIDMRFVR